MVSAAYYLTVADLKNAGVAVNRDVAVVPVIVFQTFMSIVFRLEVSNYDDPRVALTTCLLQGVLEVVLRLENFGGAVHEHGLAASQLKRIRDHGIIGPVDFGFAEWVRAKSTCFGGGPFMGSILPGSNRLIVTGTLPPLCTVIHLLSTGTPEMLCKRVSSSRSRTLASACPSANIIGATIANSPSCAPATKPPAPIC